VVAAFAQAARHLGAQICPYQEVAHLLIEGTKVTGVCTAQGETVHCHRVIIASDAWAAQCETWLNVVLPITPQFGQLLTVLQPALPLKHIVFGEAAYMTPRGKTILVLLC
jgi:glycine oxidase